MWKSKCGRVSVEELEEVETVAMVENIGGGDEVRCNEGKMVNAFTRIKKC